MDMNELDRFFKDKLDNRQIEFNEAHWQEAEKMLDRQGKKRPAWMWWIALGILLLLGGTWWGLSRYSVSAKGPENTIPEVADVVLEEQSTALPSDAVKATQTNENTNDSELTTTGSPLASPELKSERDQSHMVKEDVDEEVIQGVQSISQDKTIAGNTPAKQSGELANDTSIAGNEEPEIGRIEEDGQSALEEENVAVVDLANEQLVQEQNIENTNTSKAQNTEEQSQNTLNIDEKTTKPFALLEAISVMNPGFLDVPKSATNFRDPYKIKTPTQLSLGFHAMATLYPSFESGNQRLIGSNLGLDVRFSGRSPWGFRTGLNYRIRGGQFSFTDSLSEVTYGFGRSEKQYTLTPRSVHYLELPLAVSYRFRQHEIQAGGQIGYLSGVKGQLEVPLEGSPLRRTTEAGWMEKDGFNQLRIDLSLGYHYAITRQLKAGLLLHYTPINWIENTDKLKENGPFTIDVGLRFDLF